MPLSRHHPGPRPRGCARAPGADGSGDRRVAALRTGLGIQAVLTAVAALILLAVPGIPSPPLYVSLAGFAMAGILVAVQRHLGLPEGLRLGLRRRLPAARRIEDDRRDGPAAARGRGAAAAGLRGHRCGGLRRHRARHLASRADPGDHQHRRPVLRQSRQADQGDRSVPLVRQHRGADRPQPRRAVDLRELRRRCADAAVQFLLPRHLQLASGIRRERLLVSAALGVRAAGHAEHRHRHVRPVRGFLAADPLADVADPQPVRALARQRHALPDPVHRRGGRQPGPADPGRRQQLHRADHDAVDPAAQPGGAARLVHRDPLDPVARLRGAVHRRGDPGLPGLAGDRLRGGRDVAHPLDRPAADRARLPAGEGRGGFPLRAGPQPRLLGADRAAAGRARGEPRGWRRCSTG